MADPVAQRRISFDPSKISRETEPKGKRSLSFDPSDTPKESETKAKMRRTLSFDPSKISRETEPKGKRSLSFDPPDTPKESETKAKEGKNLSFTPPNPQQKIADAGLTKTHKVDTPVPPKEGEKQVPKSADPPQEMPEKPLQSSRYSEEKTNRRRAGLIRYLKQNLDFEKKSDKGSTMGQGVFVSYTLMVYEIGKRDESITHDAFSHKVVSNLKFLIKYLERIEPSFYEHAVLIYDLYRIYEMGLKADHMRVNSGPYHPDLPRIMDTWFNIVENLHAIHTRDAENMLEMVLVTATHYDWYTEPLEQMIKLKKEMKSVFPRS